MRLIDADAYKTEMKIRQDACAEWRDEAKADGNEEQYARAEQALATFIEAKLTLDKMPTIEAEPVKHGRWIVKTYEHKYENGFWTENRTECSVCGNRPLYDEYRQKAESGYCPKCGAKMDCEQGVTEYLRKVGVTI